MRPGLSSKRALCATFIVCAVALAGQAQATVLLQDTFALGVRPSAGGDPVLVNVGTSLAGKRAQIPSTADEAWITNAAPGKPSWAFSASTADPFETPAPGTNGTVTYNVGDENPPRPSFATALLNFAAPTGAFQESLDVVTAAGASSLAIGFTSSIDVTGDNFDQFGLFSLALQTGTGAWTLSTGDGSSLSGITVLGGFNRLILSYDPVGHTVQGSVNGVLTGALDYTASGIAAVGFRGVGTVDNFKVETNGLSGAGSVPEPQSWALMILGFGVIGALARRRQARPAL